MIPTIICLNWNTAQSTIRLYKSLIENTSNHFDVIILDNGSNTKDYNLLTENIKDATIIRQEKNLGFAAGNNQALKYVKHNDFVVFINSDIVIQEKNWNEKFEKIFEDKTVGIVGCAYHPLKWTKDGQFHIQLITDHAVESESVQGAFFAINGELYKCLIEKDDYVFDEQFKYAQYEETDLCFRVRKMNYKVYWLPLKHLHEHNKSATKINGYHLNDEIKNINDFKANSERNKQLFIKRHMNFL